MDESHNQFAQVPNLSILKTLNEETESLGPQNNTAMFYLYGDLSINPEGQLAISQDRASGNRFDENTWRLSLRDQLARICEESINGHSTSIESSFWTSDLWIRSFVSANPPLPSALRGFVDMKSDVANCENLWVIISANESQNSWFAPELNGSAFSFFVAKGLAGWAEAEGDEISLNQLFVYVQNSVARSARDNRDSTQTPMLISVNDSKNADKISVIYREKKPALPSLISCDYERPDLDSLWEELTEVRKSHFNWPHQIAMIESRLVRLEEARYCSTSGGSRSLKVVNELKEEINNLINLLPQQSRNDVEPISLAQNEGIEFDSQFFPFCGTPRLSLSNVE